MVERVSQWLSFRQALSDWRTGSQNFSKELVSLSNQAALTFSDHPLLMEDLYSCIGLEVIGGNQFPTGALPLVSYKDAIVPNPVPFVPVCMTWMESGYA